MTSPVFIKIKAQTPFSYYNESFSDIKTFFRGFFSYDDKSYEVKYLSKNSILIEEKKLKNPRLQTLLKVVLSITLIAPAIGACYLIYHHFFQLSDRKVIQYKPYAIQPKDFEELKTSLRQRNSNRRLQDIPSDGVNKRLNQCKDFYELAETMISLAENQSEIIEDFIEKSEEIHNKESFKLQFKENINNSIKELLKSKLKKIAIDDLDTTQNPPDFLAFLVEKKRLILCEKLRSLKLIEQDNFVAIYKLFEKNIKAKAIEFLKSEIDSKTMVSLIEFIQWEFGTKTVRSILDKTSVQMLVPSSISQIDSLQVSFIEPHVYLFNMVKIALEMTTLSFAIQASNFYLPSATETLSKTLSLLPQAFTNEEKETKIYLTLKNLIESLAQAPTNNTLDLVELNKFKQAYNSIAEKFDLPPMEIDLADEHDSLIAQQYQSHEDENLARRAQLEEFNANY